VLVPWPLLVHVFLGPTKWSIVPPLMSGLGFSFCFLYLVVSIIILIIFIVCLNILDPLNSFMPPSLVWALLIIEVFLYISHFCPLVRAMILAKVNFLKKSILSSKGDCKRYILSLWKDYQKWSFLISNACILN
jgi:hypothetical protein